METGKSTGLTRQEFLDEIWTKYPVAPSEKPEWCFGRVKEIHNNSLTLFSQNEEISLQLTEVQMQHPELGVSIPADCLRRGDVIAFNKSTEAFYLLSPCLEPSPKLFNDQAKKWSQFLGKVRGFFEREGFLHLDTPFLVESPGVDHHIDFMRVQGVQSKKQWHLPTSPEIHLKKFLCQGYENIFEIKKCFRDDLPGVHHKPEFTMIEWYRAYASLSDIAEDLKKLCAFLSDKGVEFEETSIQQLFKEVLEVDLNPNTSREELLALNTRLGTSPRDDDDWNDLFFRLFIEFIEPKLGSGPVFLWGFPPQQASLSQIGSDGWCQRFELYWNGVELANAYLEVNDPILNEDRFQLEQELRQKSAKEGSAFDLDFFKQMYGGMPPASGIAMGLDRLFMVLSGASHLE